MFHPWVAVANKILKDFGSANIFHTNLSLSPRMHTYPQNIPLFYKDLINTLQTLSQGTCHDLEFVLSQSIWNNYFIKSNHSTSFNSELQSRLFLICKHCCTLYGDLLFCTVCLSGVVGWESLGRGRT